MEELKKYIRIGAASRMIGVSANTLREWDKKNILNAERCVLNNKREYLLEDIYAFIRAYRYKKNNLPENK